MGKKDRLVVIGGTAAGLSAASKAKRLNPDLQITVFEKTGYISYGACGLPYFVGGLIGEPEDLISVSVSEMKEKRNIPVLIHHEVTAIHRQEKEVIVKNLETGVSSAYGYDYLVIATGAVPVIPKLDGIDSKGVCVLRTVEDGIYMKYLASDARRVCIVGGGFIGLELSEQFAAKGLKVTVIEAMDRMLPFLPDAFSHMIQGTLESNGIKVMTGTPVTRIENEAGRVKGVCGPDGIPIPCDLAVLSIGVRPATALAEAAGLELGLKGGIVVDEHQRTGDPAVFACGDCVQMKHILSGKNVYIPLGTTANKMGRVAGSVIGGENASFPGVLGSMVTKVFDCCIAATGLSFAAAKDAGFHAAETLISKSDRASYYPGGRANFINLVFDTEDGRLLGAQGIGSDSVAGRINVLAACITAGMTVAQVNDLDLVYAPPLAPVYDPILIAASQALKLVEC